MVLSNWSHLAVNAQSLSCESSFLSSEGVANAAFNVDEWMDFSSLSVDEPLQVNVVGPVRPGSFGSDHPLNVRSSLMASKLSSSSSGSIAISAAFTPTSDNPLWPLPDIILLSTDSVVFYVSQYTLLSVSANFFRGLLPIVSEDKTKRICYVEECSTVLNTILHIFYNTTSNPTCFADAATLLKAVDCLPLYGVSLVSCLHPSSYLYALLISQAPLLPFDFYAFAAHHGIEDLAVTVSPYTLQRPLWVISEQLAERMGSTYFKRLCFLHLECKDAFEQALQVVPVPSLSYSNKCSFKDHVNMRSAWVEGAAYCMEWAAQRGGEIMSDEVRSIFGHAMRDISCEDCQKAKDEHLNKILMQRSLAKRTI